MINRAVSSKYKHSTTMKVSIFLTIFILLAVWESGTQTCVKTDDFSCNQVDPDNCIASYSIEIDNSEDTASTGYCREITGVPLRGTFRIHCPGMNQCFRKKIETECESCVTDTTHDKVCNCECTVMCIATGEDGREKAERDINTTVTFETKAQTLISTTVIETITTTTMNSSSQPTATDNIMIRTRPPLIRNITTLSPSNTRPSPPVILPQYLAYGLPIGVILIIIVIALVVSIIVCLCCSRRMSSKAKDPESDIIAINTRNMTPENELANEPTYSSISETINSCKPPTDHNNNNNINHRVMTNRSENVYSQVESSMSLSEVTTPNGMIQNVLYNVFATETDYTNNMYHVLAADDVTDSSFEKHYKSMVGGEVINPSVYEKIPSLQSIEVQRDNLHNLRGGLVRIIMLSVAVG